MRVLGFFTLCVAASVAACSPTMGSGPTGSGQATGASPGAVSGSTGPTAPITSTELENVGTIPVIVFGAAFGLDRGMIEQAVADDMQASTNAPFVPSSQANVEPQGYSVVMLFNAPDGSDPSAYCSSDPPMPVTGPAQRYGGWGDVELAGVLCRNGQQVREVWTGVGNVSSLDDPGFRNLIRQAGTKLAP